MRLANFIEGLFFMVGFLVVCLVVMTSRPLQPLRRARPCRLSTSRSAGLTQFIKSTGRKSDHGRAARIAASTSPRCGIDGCAPDFVQARLPAAADIVSAF